MNTLVNVVISFVVFLLNAAFAFVNAFKIPLAVAGVIGILIVGFPAGAHADPGLGACGQCTSNIIGLSADWFIGGLILVWCIGYTIYLVLTDKES